MKGLMDPLKRLNEALPALVVGILCYGLLCEALSIWFVRDKVNWSVGLLAGIGCAVFMAVHIALVIDDSVRFGTQPKVLAAKSVMRYLVVAVVFFALAITGAGDVIAAFIGAMGLKVAAYAQPKVDRIFFGKRDDAGDGTP